MWLSPASNFTEHLVALTPTSRNHFQNSIPSKQSADQHSLIFQNQSKRDKISVYFCCICSCAEKTRRKFVGHLLPQFLFSNVLLSFASPINWTNIQLIFSD